MACVSTELVSIIYDKGDVNQVLSVETIKQEIQNAEKNDQQIELD